MADSAKLWTRSFIALMVIQFATALSFYLLVAVITPYAMDTYSVSHAAGAMTVTIFVIAALISRVLFGRQIDRMGVKRALALGLVLNVATSLAYLMPLPYYALLAVRAVNGVGFALTSGSAGAGAALIIPAARRGEGIGYFSMMQALATGIGPFIAIALREAGSNYTLLFICSAAICILGLAALLFVSVPKVEAAPTADAPSQRGILSLVQVAVLPIAAVMLLVYLGYSGLVSFVVLYAESIDLSRAASLFFVVYAVVILISRPPIGRRVDRKGENSCVYMTLAALVLAFIMLAAAINGAMLLAAAALAGFGIGATQSVIQAVIARDTPAAEQGRATSTFLMNMDLGSGIGPVIIGAFVPLVGYRPIYAALAVVALAALALYHFVHGRSH